METILNKVIVTINKEEDSQLLSTHQYAETAGGVNLKQFTMKYQAFNNHVFVNTVFICKRVYFLTVGHQRETVRWIIYYGPPDAGHCSSERLFGGSHRKTLIVWFPTERPWNKGRPH